MKKKQVSSTKTAMLKAKKEEEFLAAAKIETAAVRGEVQIAFKTAEMIAVGVEFNEVSFYVDPSEFDNAIRKGTVSTDKIEMSYEKCDRECLALYYSYKLKTKQ